MFITTHSRHGLHQVIAYMQMEVAAKFHADAKFVPSSLMVFPTLRAY
jgi:hypothetical protein